MLVTEKEAKMKFCQESFSATKVGNWGLCIASGCMAWRWFYDMEIADRQL